MIYLKGCLGTFKIKLRRSTQSPGTKKSPTKTSVDGSGKRKKLGRCVSIEFENEVASNLIISRLSELPAFHPTSIVDGLIGMFEMREQSLLNDSFKHSLSRVFQSVGLAPIVSSTDPVGTYALYRGPHTPSSLQKRFGLKEDEALWEERDPNSIGGIMLGVDLRSEAGEEYDFEAIQDPPPALATAAAIEILDSDDGSDDERT